jgi:hypothetical protein
LPCQLCSKRPRLWPGASLSAVPSSDNATERKRKRRRVGVAAGVVVAGAEEVAVRKDADGRWSQ